MISTSAVSLRRLTLFDDTLKNLRGGLDEGPIIPFLIILAVPQENCPFYCSLSSDNGLVRFEQNEYKVENLIVEFSPNGKKLCDYLEKIISQIASAS